MAAAIAGLVIVPVASATGVFSRPVAHHAAYRDAYRTAHWVASHAGPITEPMTPLYRERKRMLAQLSALDPTYQGGNEHANAISVSCQRRSSSRFRCRQFVQFRGTESYTYNIPLTNCVDEIDVVGRNQHHWIEYHPKSVQCHKASQVA
jgi:hypothetical protein